MPRARLAVSCLLATVLSLLGLVPRTHAQQAPDDDPVPTPADALLALVRAGDSADPLLPLPGFGPAALRAVAFSLDPLPEHKWKHTKEMRTLSLGEWQCELRELPADWAQVRALLPKPQDADQYRVHKILWTGVNGWYVAPTAKAGAERVMRCLLAPVGEGFLLLRFSGPAARLEEERPAMRAVALSLRFVLQGFVAEYHNSVDLTNRQRIQVDPVIDFNWGEGSPSADVGPDVFSVRWTATLRPRHTETYTFFTTTDDGVRLWIDDRPVLENWTEHPATEDSGSVDLAADREYRLRMEWYENFVHASARLEWQSDSQPREVVPAVCLEARPPPYIALAPEPPPGAGEEYGGLPSLPYGTQPGGYTSANPEGLRWLGQRGAQTLTFGKPPATVQVSLRRLPLRAPQARSLLPAFTEADRVETKAILWLDAPGWCVEGALDPAAHPDEPLRFQRHYLVPLRHGLLHLRFASADGDWYTAQRETFLAVFNSIELTAQEQAESRPTADRSLF